MSKSNLERYDVQELDQDELQSIKGGFLGCLITMGTLVLITLIIRWANY